MKLVVLSSKTCGPCMVMKNTLKKFNRPDVEVEYYDTNEKPEMIGYFNITSIPTLIALQDTEELGRLTGIHTLDEVNNLFN